MIKKIPKKDRDAIIKLLQAGKDIPSKYRDLLCKDEDVAKEYELVYAGKAREEDIIADTLAAPLQEVRTFNRENKFDDEWTNKLIFGDNLMALKNLYEDPDIKGKVKLIYIDPPFATKKDFLKDEEKAYKDKVVGSKFIEFTRKRLILLRELLAEDGTIYVHLDQKKGHYIKVILDEIFIESNFRNELIWKYTGSRAPDNDFPSKHDVIYRYSRKSACVFNHLFTEYSEGAINRFDKKDKDGRYKITHRDGKEYKTYMKEGKRMEDVWDIPIVMKNDSQYTFYPTQKPEALLEIMIKASSNKGDIVIDAFAGSGITLAVAEKLNRRWIGIDCGKLSIYTTQKRILQICNSRDLLAPKSEKKKYGKCHKCNNDKVLCSLEFTDATKKYNKNAQRFTLYNAGLYDWSEIKKLDFEHYRDFVLKLFQVREEKHTIRGVEVDGYIGNDNAYLWDHSKEKKAKLDKDFVKSLHEALSGKGGDVFYVIAPTNAFAFFEDEVPIGDTTYKTLRVPQSVITELIKRGGETLMQPTSEKDVNDTIDAVGFDFIQVPDVKITYKLAKPKEKTLLNQKVKECVIKIKEFRSRTLTKSPEEFENYETLSMVMIDYNYDGKVFDLDDVFYADEIKCDLIVKKLINR